MLQGIAVCNRCGRRMGVRYSGPHGDYPVYHCSADQGMTGQPRCQEVRTLGADAAFERVLLDALTPDQVAIAVAAVGQIEAEAQALEHQWGLKRERDHGKDSCAILTHRRRAAESPRQAIAVLSGAVH